MSLRRFLTKIRKADKNSPTTSSSSYTSNVTTTPSHVLPGRDSESVRQPEYSLTNTLGVAEASQVATPDYIYYRIYAEDGALPSKTPVAVGNPFVARIKTRSVPPPRTIKVLKCSIAKVENIKDRESTTLFLAPYSHTPMDDAEKLTILNDTGSGSTPQEPLALVAKMSNSERSALESKRKGVAAEPDAAIQYLYYLLYADDYEIPSNVAINPEEPSLGRIQADSVAPPHGPTSIKRCISRVERNPALAYADLFADTSCNTPLKEGHISILHTDDLGVSPNKPMAIVQLEVKKSPIPDGKYVIKNRAANIYWNAGSRNNPIRTVYFYFTTMEYVKTNTHMQWIIENDANGNISMTSMAAPYGTTSWVGADMTESTVPVPWQLIPADSKSYYLTTDMNHFSQNPRVPQAAAGHQRTNNLVGEMASLTEGDQRQMWEFIRI